MQPYTIMLVFRISTVDGDGKVKIVHHNLFLPIGTNTEGPGNQEDQHDVNRAQDYIQAVIGDATMG